MFQLVLEKAEETEIKLPTSIGSQKKQENSRKNIYFCFIDYAKAFDCVEHNCGKFLKRWEYQTTLPASCKTCMQVKKQQLEPDLNNLLDQNWERNTSRLYTVILLFKLYAEYIIRNARLDEAQARIKNVQRNINSLRYADDTTFMAESKEQLKSLLMKVKEKSEKSGLNTQHSKN